MINEPAYQALIEEIKDRGVTVVAVSKLKPISDIKALYELGQRDFGENYVQEIVEKQGQLPQDIRWHYIGHLQTNKVKYIAPFVHLIHAVDSFKLLLEINKQATKHDRVIDVLLQLHIAQEDTKHGMDEKELWDFFQYYDAQKEALSNVRIRGLMGMASFTENIQQVADEFDKLRQSFESLSKTQFFNQESFNIVSTGMSGDYKIAMGKGSTMIRIGSALFGTR